MKNVMILVGKLEINGKLFSMQDSEGTVYATQLGLQDDFYGGAVREFRKTKYGIFMCVDRVERIINLAYTEESLTDEGRKLLGEPVPVKVPAPKKNPVEKKKDSVGAMKNKSPKVNSHKKAVKVNVPEKIEEQKNEGPEVKGPAIKDSEVNPF